jgi:hypothetical protein
MKFMLNYNLLYILESNLVQHETAIRFLRLKIRVVWGGIKCVLLCFAVRNLMII